MGNPKSAMGTYLVNGVCGNEGTPGAPILHFSLVVNSADAAWDPIHLFQLPYGEWIRLFRANGFEILDLIELRPPSRPRTTYTDYAPLEWSRRWPGENIWKLRKPG